MAPDDNCNFASMGWEGDRVAFSSVLLQKPQCWKGGHGNGCVHQGVDEQQGCRGSATCLSRGIGKYSFGQKTHHFAIAFHRQMHLVVVSSLLCHSGGSQIIASPRPLLSHPLQGTALSFIALFSGLDATETLVASFVSLFPQASPV